MFVGEKPTVNWKSADSFWKSADCFWLISRLFLTNQPIVSENQPIVSENLPIVSENLPTHVWQAATYATRQTRAWIKRPPFFNKAVSAQDYEG